MNPQLQTMLQQAIQAFQGLNFDEADLILREVLQKDINSAEIIFELGMTYAKANRFTEALSVFYCLQPYKNSDVRIPYNLGLIHSLQGRHELALEAYDFALRIAPNDVDVLINKGSTCNDNKNYFLALEVLEKAIQIRSDIPEAWSNKGIALNNLNLYQKSIDAHSRAINLNPSYYEAWSNKSAPLNKLRRFLEASEACDTALNLKPDFAEAWSNKGVTLHELKRYDEAITHYDKAISLKPDFAEAWSNKGDTLSKLAQYSESAECYQKALEFPLQNSYLLGKAHHQMMLGCNWTNYEKNINEIFHLTSEGKKVSEPFGFQGIATSEGLLKKCAEIYSNDKYPALENLTRNLKYQHNKVRIGYLCGEFRNQATSILMTRVWELHDKSKFEIFAFDNGWDDGSNYRQRFISAFSYIFDISKLSDLDAAKLIQHNEIDILINLNGFFGLARQGIFSYKPAPIQVSYLGFPGTIGIEYMDYIIADKVVIPEESKVHYVEKIAYLPNSYQANDDQRKISDRQFSRSQFCLPEDVFVFACFNNNYKITPSIFDSWMRILSLVQGSVLWLLADNPIAKNNLIKEAVARGIDSSRLVFADRLPISEHLGRHRLADLFLDTLPYNAHTTCSDALWAGLPILTLMGHTFPGRVSASLLSAIGLGELITNTQREYEALAIELAMNPEKLAKIKLKLAKNRLTAPLFDAPLFTKCIEAAYIKMYEQYQADLEPEHISVT